MEDLSEVNKRKNSVTKKKKKVKPPVEEPEPKPKIYNQVKEAQGMFIALKPGSLKNVSQFTI